MTSSKQPPRWETRDFDRDALISTDEFMQARLKEPTAEYEHHFSSNLDLVDRLLELTDDLTLLKGVSKDVLGDRELQSALRYVVGPPISKDDLRTIAGRSLAPSKLRQDEERATRVVEVLMPGLDNHRFPWVIANRRPSKAERRAALVATAALMASQQLKTKRANRSKEAQELAVMAQLRSRGLRQVDAKPIPTTQHGPGPGKYCSETMLGERKADIVIGLYDRRIMPVECKVSNSSTNSIKRLNNDAAVKATAWLAAFGHVNVVPAAVLSGVFKTRNLMQAQNAGLAIFWQHALAELGDFVCSTQTNVNP